MKKIDDEWYIGRLGDQQGMFPVKFVEIIEDLPQETGLEIQVLFYRNALFLLNSLLSNKSEYIVT